MVYGNDAGRNILLLGGLILIVMIGMALTLISFVVHRNEHPTAAAILASVGYICKLPLYVLGAASIPDIIYRGEIVLCLTLTVIIIAATGYAVHLIMFAVRAAGRGNDRLDTFREDK